MPLQRIRHRPTTATRNGLVWLDKRFLDLGSAEPVSGDIDHVIPYGRG